MTEDKPGLDREKIEKALHDGAEKLDERFEEAAEKVRAEGAALLDRIKSNPQLKREWSKAKVIFDLVGDYASGDYRTVPKGTVVLAVFTLLYLISPVDVIPDAIPVIGILDDLALFMVTWSLLGDEARKYAIWRAGHDADYAALRDAIL